MTNPINLNDLALAKEWAEYHAGSESVLQEAAAKVILSLPDPQPRTLADMTPEERAECQWMQCDIVDDDERPVIIWSDNTESMVVYPDGRYARPDLEHVTPRQDLPRLEWPADHPECECSPVSPEKWTTHYGATDPSTMTEYEPSCPVHGEHAGEGRDTPTPPPSQQATPRPEDVKPGEVWKVIAFNHEWAGGRVMSYDEPCWVLTNLDGDGYIIADDSNVTLVARMVEDTPPRTLTTLEDNGWHLIKENE